MYKLLQPRFNHPAGTIVYVAYYDYGLAQDDTNYTGEEHISVTLKPDGGYPFFTVPLYYLKKI
jgi:hypothetical protein